MANETYQFSPTGNMDKDSDPRSVGKGDGRQGDYIDSRNTQVVSDQGGDGGAITPTYGNDFAFDLGSVTAQNKRYRVTVDGDATKSHQLRFLSTDRSVNIVTGTGPNGEVEFNGTAASLVAAVNAAMLPSLLSITTSGNNVEFQLNPYSFYQWYLDSVGTDDVTVICTQEAIPVDLAGDLKDIGSYDLLGDLFVFSTTQDNEPIDSGLEIAGVGPVYGGQFVGPITTVTFTTDHNLQIGQWIRITGSEQSWQNGVFVIHTIPNSTTIGIVTNTAWGQSYPTGISGPNTAITVNPSGIGEIGVAVKDDNEDNWTYTRLLRSVELNFISKKPIQAQAEKEISESAIYFDDDHNPYRSFYYSGEYIEDGAVSYVNSANTYAYGQISTQIYGFENSANISIDFVSQSENGGVLESGNYRYFVVLKDFSENNTEPSDLSNQVIVYSDNQNALSVGDEYGTVTTKANNILISNINENVYEKIAIGVYTVVNGVASAYLLPFDLINGPQYQYKHTGLEDQEPYDVGVFAAKIAGGYDYAKNISIIDETIVRSNLRRRYLPDLANFFKTFSHAVCVDKSIDTTSAPNGSNPANEFKDPSNVFYKSGYMFNETYRFSGRAVFKDGSVSDWYWIDDIRIDPFQTNQANPNDNRRNQSVPNAAVGFDLVEDISTQPTTGHVRPSGSYFNNQGEFEADPQNGENRFMSKNTLYSNKRILVPYVEFFDINTSYSINGQPVSNIIEYIEFGREEVVKEVISTGVAIGSVRLLTANDVPMGFDENPAIDDIYRGFPLFGLFTKSFDFPTVNLGIGVRTDDLDAFDDTFHEYPFVYSSFPISGVTQGNISPNTPFANQVINFFANNFVIEWGQPLGEWINVLMGINFQNNSSNPFPDTNSVYYPSTNGQDFYVSDIVKTENITIGTPIKQENFQNTMRSERRVWTIYSPDLIFGNENGNGAKIIDFGEMFLDPTQTANSFYTRGDVNMNRTHMPSCVTRYYPQNLSDTYVEYDIDSMEEISDGERANLFGFSGFRKAHDAYIFSDNGFFQSNVGGVKRLGIEGLWKMIKSPVVYIENGGNGIESQGKNNDHGIRYIQTFIRKDNKYGPIEDSEYYSTGTRVYLEGVVGTIPHSIVKVFGGDTFTQQSFLKTKYADYTTASGGGPTPDWDESLTNFPADDGCGFSGGLFVYTQNRKNSQLRYGNSDQFIYLKDTTLLGEWAWDFKLLDKHTYSSIYNSISNENIVQLGGNIEFNLSKFEFPTRITWSTKKIYGEKIDSYRRFFPFNIKDLTLSFGEINHHENVGGELFTLQQRKFQIQAFNARGQLETTANSVDVLLKSGDVLSQDGKTLSFYGTEHKWSAILGRSDSGKDVIYWFNAENGLMMRFGADGTRVISARGMSSFFVNYTKWVKNKHEHAFEQGVRGVWDDRRKEAIWTFYGWRDVPQWVATQFPLTQSTVGTVVRNDNAPSDTYENTPRFFRCIVAHANSAATEPAVGADWEQYWEQVPYTDFNYYSIFTIAFNELTNGFRCFYGHLPKTYLQWSNTFLSSHPNQRNLIFEHRKGAPTTWYGFPNGGKPIAPKVEDAYIEAVINPVPAEKKRYLDGLYVTDIAPYRVEYRTGTQETFDTEAEFAQDENEWKAPIRNDITQTGDPTADGDHMYGGFLKVRYFFEGGKFSMLYSFLIKLYRKARLINR